jgi:hypothetical protein
MSEWWTYRPEDFLLFSPRVYWRLFELTNAALWPLQLLTLGAGAALVLLALWRPRGHGLWIALVLAMLWAFVGYAFLWSRYATINWAIAYVAPLFGVEAILLALAGATGGLTFDRRGIPGWSGWVLAAVGVLVYPLLPLLFGRPWASAEVFGIAPDPTAIVALGLLLGARGRLLPLLLPIPLLWLAVSGLTLRTMGDAQAWLPFMTILATLAAGLVRQKQARPS